MFFRREKPRTPTFQERLDTLRSLGFTVESAPGGGSRVGHHGCAAILEDRGGPHPHVNKAGLVIGGEIAEMVHGGYQMFWRTPSGRTAPALSDQLHALHDFEEDLKEGLGLTSLYNESLGTTADQHLYDRVVKRDQGSQPRPWERKSRPVAS